MHQAIESTQFASFAERLFSNHKLHAMKSNIANRKLKEPPTEPSGYP